MAEWQLVEELEVTCYRGLAHLAWTGYLWCLNKTRHRKRYPLLGRGIRGSTFR